MWPTAVWLWCRPAAATPIPPLAWELPYVTGVATKKKKKRKGRKKKKKERKKETIHEFFQGLKIFYLYFFKYS